MLPFVNPSVTAYAVPPPFSLREKGGFWAVLLHTGVPLTKRLPCVRGAVSEADCRLSKNPRESARGTELRRRQWRKRAKRKSNEQRRLASGSVARRLLRIVEPKPFRAPIVPGGVYGGDGAIFAAENPIFQSKNRFLAVSAPENP